MNLKNSLCLVLALCSITLVGFIIHNNYGDALVSEEEAQTSFEKAVSWLLSNREAIKKRHNPILWWMLREVVYITGNHELHGIIKEYASDNYHRYVGTPWSYLVLNSKPNRPLDSALFLGLSDYNLHFLYGLSCDSDIGKLDIISKQNETDFCFKNHPFTPACLTHQMMGFRFMQRKGCIEVEGFAEKTAKISKYIMIQSAIDFRVVDVYIQRVLMLLESNNADKVNPRWIKRIIMHQRDDGGWGDFEPLIPFHRNICLGFSSKGVSLTTPKSTFHATAQGAWLMALLLNNKDFFNQN